MAGDAVTATVIRDRDVRERKENLIADAEDVTMIVTVTMHLGEDRCLRLAGAMITMIPVAAKFRKIENPTKWSCLPEAERYRK